MIQRIQTLYLFLVVVLGTLLCFFAPVTYVTGELTQISLSTMSQVPLAIITIAIPLLALIDIFLYKKRILQARLNIINIVLCLGWYAICFVYVWFDKQNLGIDWYPTVWAAIPLVCLILTMMAMRRILSDEALVRAADRIR